VLERQLIEFLGTLLNPAFAPFSNGFHVDADLLRHVGAVRPWIAVKAQRDLGSLDAGVRSSYRPGKITTSNLGNDALVQHFLSPYQKAKLSILLEFAWRHIDEIR